MVDVLDGSGRDPGVGPETGFGMGDGLEKEQNGERDEIRNLAEPHCKI